MALMELDRDARMRVGAERRAGAHLVVFEAAPNNWLRVMYGTRTDHIPKVEWAEACAELAGAPMDCAEFAAYYSTAFWLYHYYGREPGDLEGLVKE